MYAGVVQLVIGTSFTTTASVLNLWVNEQPASPPQAPQSFSLWLSVQSKRESGGLEMGTALIIIHTDLISESQSHYTALLEGYS